MNLKEELSQKLYDTFVNNDLLQYVEAITNANNLVTVDVYDIEPFENYRYLGKQDYKSNEEIPFMKDNTDKLLICFNIGSSTNLGEILNFADYISERFCTKEIVFGTNTDSSLPKGTIVANCLMFKNYSFKDKVPSKFFKDLIRCKFIDKLEEIVSLPSLINIDMDDIAAVSNYEIVGAISQSINNLDDEYIVNTISDKTPNLCIINLVSGDNLSLTTVDTLIDKIRLINKDIQIVFGASLNKNFQNNIEVNALLLYQ